MIELTINELIGLCAMAGTAGLVFGLALGGIVARWLDRRDKAAMDQFFTRRQERPDITDQAP